MRARLFQAPQCGAALRSSGPADSFSSHQHNTHPTCPPTLPIHPMPATYITRNTHHSPQSGTCHAPHSDHDTSEVIGASIALGRTGPRLPSPHTATHRQSCAFCPCGVSLCLWFHVSCMVKLPCPVYNSIMTQTRRSPVHKLNN